MEKEVIELDLKKVFRVIKKNVIWFVLICVFCGAIAYTYTRLLVTPLYKTTAKVIVVKDYESKEEKITSTDLTLSSKLKDSYKEIIKSDIVATKVINNLGYNGKISVASYRSAVSLPETSADQVIDITVTSKDKELAQKMANEIVEVFKREVVDIMHVDNVQTLNEAALPTNPSSPNYTTNVIIGVLAGLVLCAIITVIITLTDNKITSQEEIKELFDYPIIGNIPDIDLKENENGGMPQDVDA